MVRDGENGLIAEPNGELRSSNQTQNNEKAESDLQIESGLQSTMSSDKKGNKNQIEEVKII